MRRIGVHTSVAGGLHMALQRAFDLECTTMQIFSHNPRQWNVRAIADEEIIKFKSLRKKLGIDPVFIHTSYLINLCSANNEVKEKSFQLLKSELDIADQLGAEYIILHTGTSHGDAETALRDAAMGIKQLSADHKWHSRILLENTAGERGDLTSKISDLDLLITETSSDIIGGICLDTCHAYAAGYDLRDAAGLESLISEIEAAMGIDMLKLIHLNDSKKAVGSGVDRHEHIGEGEIGLTGLGNIVKHPKLMNAAIVLETPKTTEEDDIKNLKRVRSFSS
ncbi:MAG: deoxyribonuclease IV [Dissulfurispiraceae bacterium]|nr:deoxyribonuclease IV [Dissulfurispiraceae bacterium]